MPASPPTFPPYQCGLCHKTHTTLKALNACCARRKPAKKRR